MEYNKSVREPKERKIAGRMEFFLLYSLHYSICVEFTRFIYVFIYFPSLLIWTLGRGAFFPSS